MLPVRRGNKPRVPRIPLIGRRADAPGADAGERFEFAQQLWEQGRCADAVTVVRKLVGEPVSASLRQALGQFLSDAGELHAARDNFERLAAEEAESALAQYSLGRIYDQLGRVEDALRAHRRAIELEPENAECHYRMGVTLARAERLGEAEESYRRAIALDRGHARA